MPGPTGLEAIELIVAGAADVADARPAPSSSRSARPRATPSAALAAPAGFADVRVEPDLAGRDRALVARR